jgi:hypothetical protein
MDTSYESDAVMAPDANVMLAPAATGPVTMAVGSPQRKVPPVAAVQIPPHRFPASAGMSENVWASVDDVDPPAAAPKTIAWRAYDPPEISFAPVVPGSAE